MKRDINISRLLESICKDGGEDDILEFAVWKVVLRNLDEDINQKMTLEQRKERVMDILQSEVDKWIK